MAAEVAELLLANHAAVPAPVAAVEETLLPSVSRAAPALQDPAAGHPAVCAARQTGDSLPVKPVILPDESHAEARSRTPPY